MYVPTKVDKGKDEVQIEKEPPQDTDNDEGEYPFPFKSKAPWEQYQMGELVKNVEPTMVEISMLGNYKKAWKSLKIFCMPEGLNKPKSLVKLKIPIKAKGNSQRKDEKKLDLLMQQEVS